MRRRPWFSTSDGSEVRAYLRRTLRQPEIALAVVFLAVTFVLLGVMGLLDLVTPPEAPSADDRILLALREPGSPRDPLGPRWLDATWIDITALGSGTVVALGTAAVLAYLLLIRERRTAVAVLTCVAGAFVASSTLKELIGRARPSVVEHLVVAHTESFPSGHSLMAAAIYPTLGALIAGVVADRRARLFCEVTALGVMVLVGLSRMVLGVHYASDVLAGWGLGLSWSLACRVLLRYLQREGVVEPKPPEADDSPPASQPLPDAEP